MQPRQTNCPELLSSLQYNPLHYTTLHYTTLHYTTLHYTTLYYNTLYSCPLNYSTNCLKLLSTIQLTALTALRTAHYTAHCNVCVVHCRLYCTLHCTLYYTAHCTAHSGVLQCVPLNCSDDNWSQIKPRAAAFYRRVLRYCSTNDRRGAARRF